MLDTVKLAQDQAREWEFKDLDVPYYLNGFRGEFEFTDHDAVPEVIRNLVMHQVKHDRFKDVPLDTVTAIARAVHGGKPGVVHRVYLEIARILSKKREDREAVTLEKNVYTPTLTIDDWSANTGESNDGD